MVEDFFADFPDLSCDIPSYEEVPRTLPLFDAGSFLLAEDESEKQQELNQHDTMLAINNPSLSATATEDVEFWQPAEIPGCSLQDFLCGN